MVNKSDIDLELLNKQIMDMYYKKYFRKKKNYKKLLKNKELYDKNFELQYIINYIDYLAPRYSLIINLTENRNNDILLLDILKIIKNFLHVEKFLYRIYIEYNIPMPEIYINEKCNLKRPLKLQIIIEVDNDVIGAGVCLKTTVTSNNTSIYNSTISRYYIDINVLNPNSIEYCMDFKNPDNIITQYPTMVRKLIPENEFYYLNSRFIYIARNLYYKIITKFVISYIIKMI